MDQNDITRRQHELELEHKVPSVEARRKARVEFVERLLLEETKDSFRYRYVGEAKPMPYDLEDSVP